MDLTSLAVSVVVVILVVLVMHRSKEGTVVPASSSLVLDATPDSPMGFGYKNAWFAIKTDDSSGVIETLGLDELLPANWCSGLTASYDHYDTHVFVSPSVEGWVFVVGAVLADCGDSRRPDRCSPVLEALGQRYDSVFFFATHRVVEFHAWARVDRGRITRAYAWLGETGVTLWNRGDQTEEERALDFDFFADEPPEGEGDAYWDRDDLRFPGEEDVIRIAGEWSLSPLALDTMDVPECVGYVGQVPLIWRHNH